MKLFNAYLIPLILVVASLSLILSTPQVWAADVTLNFVDTDIETVVRSVGQSSNKNFVLDARVTGNITLNLDKPVSPLQALQALQAALRTKGFAMVETDGLVRVVPESEAKLLGGKVQAGRSGNLGNLIVTQIVKLKYETAESLLPILRPLISPNNMISAYPSNNSLVITDYADNIKRIERIIETIDIADGGSFDVVVAKNATALEIANTLTRLLDTGSADPAQRVVVVAEPRTNSILLRARNPSRLKTARQLLDKLDLPDNSQTRIHVFALKNADAVKLAETLRAVASSETALVSGADKQAQAAAVSAGGTGSKVSIQAYAASNTLVITAPDLMFNNLREIIEKLDVRRAQVYVEALIVEINADKASELGVQWMTGANGGTPYVLGTNFNAGGANILSLAAGSTIPNVGLNLGLGSTVDGKLALTTLARALATETKANVLSTPTLLTLDNEEAKIIVGQNVPFVTGQYAQTAGATSASPFQTIERKDVGLTLKIKPQIGEDGAVKLTIYQEASSVQNAANASAGLITNKRSLDSSVIVDDGQIVALGGLISDTVSETVQKVPWLGDIPYLGALFRYRTTGHTKTNLMIFLRPTVIREGKDLNRLTSNRYNQIKTNFENDGGDASLPKLPELELSNNLRGNFLLPPVKQSPRKLAPK